MSYILRIATPMLEGTVVTLILFSITLIFSIPLGLLVALFRISKNRFLRCISGGYIWLFRGTPLLLQLFFVYYGLPAFGLTLDRSTAATMAFTLNYTAYFCEIFRAGILSIDRGQYEAARALGLTQGQTMCRIILPQIIKPVLPPVANETITLVKDTALVYAIGLGELLRAAKIAVQRDAVATPFVVAAILYLAMTLVLSWIFRTLEFRSIAYE